MGYQKNNNNNNINLLLTKPEGCSREYWPKVVAVRTGTKKDQGSITLFSSATQSS